MIFCCAVFTAELPSSGEKIVVKKFFDDDIDTERKLFKEARLLNTLRHPNIVSLKARPVFRSIRLTS